MKLSDDYGGLPSVLNKSGDAIYVVSESRPVPGKPQTYQTVGKIVRDGDSFEESIRASGVAAIYEGPPKCDRGSRHRGDSGAISGH